MGSNPTSAPVIKEIKYELEGVSMGAGAVFLFWIAMAVGTAFMTFNDGGKMEKKMIDGKQKTVITVNEQEMYGNKK